MFPMRFIRVFAPSFVLAAIAIAPATAQIGPFAIGGKASTLGLGVEGAMHLAGPLALRASHTSYTLDETFESDDSNIRFDVTGTLRGTPVILDIHPFSGAFRLSAGMVFNTPRGTLHATNATTMTIGDHTYAPGEVGELNGAISGKKNAPFVGLGFDKAVFSRSRISIGFEIGTVIIGTPEPTLVATTSLTGPAKTQLDADIEKELQNFRDEIKDAPGGAKYLPLVGLSLKVRF